MRQKNPIRFLWFLLILAAALAYVQWRWPAFEEATMARGNRPAVRLGDRGAGPAEIPAGEADANRGGGVERTTPPLFTGAPRDGLPAGTPAGADTLLPVQGEGFFATSRMERERLRSEQAERVQRLLNETRLEPGNRAVLEERLVRQSEAAAAEAQIEQVIRARGYRDALAYVYEGTAVVIVEAVRLDRPAVAQLADLIQGVTGLGPERIRIVQREPRGG